MLPSKNRLSLSSAKAKLANGKRVTSNEFQIIGKKEKGIFKTATIVSKKVAPKAVDRNRIKRLISESVRASLGKIKFEGVLIIIAKQNIAKFKKAAVEEKLLKLIAKL